VVTKRQSAMSSLRASATIIVLRVGATTYTSPTTSAVQATALSCCSTASPAAAHPAAPRT
jgi:hypothetical protein